jgi:hypothetical protein
MTPSGGNEEIELGPFEVTVSKDATKRGFAHALGAASGLSAVGLLASATTVSLLAAGAVVYKRREARKSSAYALGRRDGFQAHVIDAAHRSIEAPSNTRKN